ncbi:putative ser/thr protein phosphatase [Leishmania major strain Friedlin]|uniref:Putative ser/thr protein phosphatase n=1 Tax=Leishmania major TaxID=5664 RepID=Q4QBI7_LEIMA|nr:putative ser/thr protein phosphatase [Leishmania major strain Friedlin]CAG9574027.1 ser/thr_protein_phosphatase_-_putative [Leishmania major strain Friedlin]CAJ04893.1 putative ser/thr protein phosphatase [Leishmania major strain Friedlin]|eukprot:XP_001683311.1 putative ser/thr protein phosphatase [Leishmania major strain Friedlin]
MEDKNRNLLSQLSGLRLSDGSVVGNRLGSGNTPPTLSAFGSRSTPPTTSPSSFPVSALPSHSIDALNGTHGKQQRRGNRAPRADAKKDGESPTSSVTDKINRLLAQNKGSLANSGAATSESSGGNRDTGGASILSSLAAQIVHSPSLSPSNGTASSTHTSTPTAVRTVSMPAASSSTVAVPKPRSVEVATAMSAATPAAMTIPAAAESLNPKVMEFFTKAAGGSRPPPPLVEPTAALKSAIVIEEPKNGKATAGRKEKAVAAAAGAAASSSSASPAPAVAATTSSNARSAHQAPSSTKSQKESTDPTNKFLVDAFGAIDNLDATKPIIRAAPEIPREGRYIIVGDVHGCVDQLEQLVEKVKYVKGKDCLFIIGDYVNKGPDSIGAVRACQRLGAYGVLGNHDYTLLRCCVRMRRRPFTPDDLRDPVKRLAQKLPKDCEYYLRGLPHIVRIPRHNVLLVHAGLNLQHSVENQNVEEVMHLRRLEMVPHKPGMFKAIAKGVEGEPWAKLWKGPEMVIFGHDAYAGFQAHAHACGIDTGCVYGDPLTCVVYGQNSPAGEFFSVPGLPKLENEMKGLPPPSSDIYEQEDMDLEKLIIRPTTRATPAMMNGSADSRPVFLEAPLGYKEAEESSAVGASTVSSLKASNLTATVTSTNMVMTPISTSPLRLATPTCAVNERLMATNTVNTREVQRATLLALSATRQLSAIAVLLGMPLYDQEIDAMLGSESADKVSQEAFWEPFTRLILVAAAEMPKDDTATLAGVEATLQLAFDVCEEMEAVGRTLQPELKKFLQAERESPAWSKRIVKCAETLVLA